MSQGVVKNQPTSGNIISTAILLFTFFWFFLDLITNVNFGQSFDSPEHCIKSVLAISLADFPAVFFHICNFDICHEIQIQILTNTNTKG